MVSAGLIQEKIECLAGRIHSSVDIHPSAPDFDIGLIDSPGIVCLFQIWAAAFVELWCIPLDPAVDGGVI